MGLKLIREKALKTVYYPSEEAEDRVAFKLRPATWTVRREVSNLLNAKDNEGREVMLQGDMMERVLIGCLAGWEARGDVEIPAFSETAIFELPGDVLAFLFNKIADIEFATKKGAAADPNS